MNSYAGKALDNRSRAAANNITKSKSTAQFTDKRPLVTTQRKLQTIADKSPKAQKAIQLQAGADDFTVNRLSAKPSAAPIGAAVLQRTFNVQWKGKRWLLTGRPAFRSFVLPTLIKKWNSSWDNDVEIDEDDFSLSEEELDQCHVTPWATIRDRIVEAYANGDLEEAEFIKMTDALYGPEDGDAEWKAMASERTPVIKAMRKHGSAGIEAADLKELAVLLNSATPNLRLDGSKVNRKIRDRPDPHLQWTPGGSRLDMTPNSYHNLLETRDIQNSPRWSPGRSHFFSSSVGPVSPGRLTEDAREAMNMDESDDDSG